ncbi:MAG: TolC family protein [Firmicutes bacterium]|nr:TolC family protein [Bacillota bacterium]
MVWSRKKGIWLRLMVTALVLTVFAAAPAVSRAEPHSGPEMPTSSELATLSEVPTFGEAGEVTPTQVLTLGKALSLAADKHPLVRGAQSAGDSRALALARSEAAYAPRLSLSSRPIELTADGEVEVPLADSLVVAGSLSTPQGLELSVSNKWESRNVEGSGLRVGAELQLWPPARYNGNYLSLLAAEEAVDLSVHQQRQAQQEAVIDIYSRYRTLQIEEARLKLHEEEYKAKQAAYERVVGKAEQGLASAVEVLAAQQVKEESLAEYRRAHRDHRIKLKAFLADLCLEEGAWELEPLPGTLNLPEVDISLDEAVALALEADVTLLEQSQTLKAAQRQVEAARVSGGVEVGLSAAAAFPEDGLSDGRYEAFLSFSYPILDGGIRRLDVEDAELKLQSAQEAVEKRRLEVTREVESKLSEIQYLTDKVRIANLNYEKVTLEHNAKVLQAANGLIPESEAKESQRLLAGAKLSWFEAAVALEKARLELRAMTGQVVDVEGGYPN